MNAFNHIAINCLDLAAQETFYTRHFGFKRSRTLKKGEPGEFFLMKLGSMRLEFFSSDREKAVGMQGDEQPVGFKHLAFDVPKIETILESIAAEGIEPFYQRDCSDLLPGLRIAFFRDPEGNIIELMEGYKDEE
jgi:glyoxylase I family protein